MDRIVLAGLEVWARHGVLPHERELGQRFLVDAALELDLTAAGGSDELSDTIDYGVLAERIRDTAAGGPYRLLESVAARIVDVCLEDDRVQAAEVVVTKPAAPLTVPAREVRVELRRTRS